MLPNQPAHRPKKSVLRRAIRIFLKVILGILAFLVLIILLIQTQFVQNILRKKGQDYLSGKLHTKVEIGNVYVGFPHGLSLRKIYIEDLQKDTLLYGGSLEVDMDMWKLFHGAIDVQEIRLKDITAKVKRLLPDTVFNFQFVVDAFATKDRSKSPQPRDTSALKIAIHTLVLDNIHLIYNDVVSGNDDDVRIGHSHIQIDELDLVKQHYSVPLIEFKNTNARIYTHTPLAVQKTLDKPLPASTPTSSFQLLLSKIAFTNVGVDFKDDVGSLSANLLVGSFNGNIKRMDLPNQSIALDKLELNNSQVSVSLGKKTKPPIANADSANSGSAAWRITANAISLNNNNIRFDDDNAARQKSGMDFAHINATAISVGIDDLLFSKDSISGKVTKGQLKEQSGFTLEKLQTRFLYAAHEASLEDLELRTPGTVLRRFARIRYPSINAVSHDPEKMNMDVDLENCQLQLKDILSFAPSLRSQPAFRDPNTVLHLNSRITGNTGNLIINYLQIHGFGETNIDISGKLQHVTDTKRISGNLDIKNISTGSRDIALLVPRGSIPENFAVPAHINLTGKINGQRNALSADLVLHSSSGDIFVNGWIHDFNHANAASYDAQLKLNGVKIGAILKDPENYGSVTANFSAKGTGLDRQSARAGVTGNISSLVYKKYNYENLQFQGTISNQQVHATASVDSRAAALNLTVDADISKKYPSIKTTLQIDTLDLYALHLVKDSIQLKATLTADFTDTNPDSLQGFARIDNLLLVEKDRRFHTDSVLLTAARTADMEEEIKLRAEMADFDWKGIYNISETGRSLQQTISHYYHIQKDSARGLKDQQWQMHLSLRVSPLVLALAPELKGTDSIGAQVFFNSAKNDLHVSMNAPRIKYGSNILQNAAVTASTDYNELHYDIQVSDAVSGGFRLYRSAVYGNLSNNVLSASVLLKDENNKNKYLLSGKLNKLPRGLKFVLDADSLLLNYEKWQVSTDNFFQYDSSGLVINDFKISSNSQSLQINSQSASPSGPVDVVFADFHLSSFTKFAKQDSLLADGILNGKVQVKNLMKSPVFTSDLRIKDFSFKQDTLGDLVIKVNNEEANVFAADIAMTGNRNNLRLNGKYFTGESRIDMNLDLDKLDLATIKPFTTGQFDDIHGSLQGKLSVTGTATKPVFNGNLHFDSTVIVPTLTGEPLKLSKDNIEFDKDGFNFSEFSFLDSANNKATIDGNVYTSDFRSYSFDLTFNTNNFRVVNSQQSGNKLFYGKLNMDAAANLTGDIESLKLDGEMRVNKTTDFTVVLPSNDPEVVTRLGVVRFVDKDHPGDTLVSQIKLDSFSRNAQVKGMDIAVNIETDSNARFTIIVDERSGDALNIRGRSALAFGMDKSGKMSLTGNYEVESGTYDLSLDVLKRKFNIQRGSTITWTGDPTTALINITCTYAANTAPIDLVEPQLSGRSQLEINKFKQKLPFLVSLKMEGELLKPVITFDITLPENVLSLWPDVDTKLQQIRVDASELNKQVFALLLLNRFVGENPLETAGDGLNATQLAYQSASQILTNQLNQFAGSLIKGVDINFDLNNQQDYSTGTEQDRTDLNVTVSKRLFNDRIRVNVGSNFEVQGPSTPNQNAANIAGDIAIDYQLSKDSRYMLRAYRKNQYELVVEGQVIETGVSFILTLDYNRFREIFGGTRAQRIEARKLAREARKNSTQ